MNSSEKDSELFRVVKTHVFNTKVLSKSIVKSVSNSVKVESFSIINQIVHPDPENKASSKMNKTAAATKIQALQRQRRSSRDILKMREHRAAIILQCAQRRKSAMNKYLKISGLKGSSSLNPTQALHDLISAADITDTSNAIDDLMAAKADLEFKSEDGYSAVLLACYYQGASVIRQLIEFNASLDTVGPQGDTLLVAAASRSPCQPELVSLLLDYPETLENINARETEYGSTALFLLCQEFNSGNPEYQSQSRCEQVVRGLLATEKVDVNLGNKNGDTPLMMAVDNHAYELAQLLIDHAADVNIANENGASAATMAEHNKDDDMWYILGGEFDD